MPDTISFKIYCTGHLTFEAAFLAGLPLLLNTDFLCLSAPPVPALPCADSIVADRILRV